MKARIYKPAKNAMQSGFKAKEFWVLEYAPEEKKFIDPLTGWTGSPDTNQQVKLKFKTKEEAIAFANAKKIDFDLTLPKPRKEVKKSYADNFAYTAPQN